MVFLSSLFLLCFVVNGIFCVCISLTGIVVYLNMKLGKKCDISKVNFWINLFIYNGIYMASNSILKISKIESANPVLYMEAYLCLLSIPVICIYKKESLCHHIVSMYFNILILNVTFFSRGIYKVVLKFLSLVFSQFFTQQPTSCLAVAFFRGFEILAYVLSLRLPVKFKTCIIVDFFQF